MKEKKQWFWGRDERNARFVAVSTKLGRSSLRVFDARTGISCSEVVRGSGPWHEQWPVLARMVPLLPARFPNLAVECKTRIPRDVFEDLSSQVRDQMAKLPPVPEPAPLTREVLAKYLDPNVLARFWPREVACATREE